MLSDGHGALKSIYFCWQHFAGNDFQTFLAGKQRIKFSPIGITFHHFKMQRNSFHKKIRHVRHTSDNLSLDSLDHALPINFNPLSKIARLHRVIVKQNFHTKTVIGIPERHATLFCLCQGSLSDKRI